MNAVSPQDQYCPLQLELPNGTEATLAITPGELKRIIVILGERDCLSAWAVEMLLLSLGLEGA